MRRRASVNINIYVPIFLRIGMTGKKVTVYYFKFQMNFYNQLFLIAVLNNYNHNQPKPTIRTWNVVTRKVKTKHGNNFAEELTNLPSIPNTLDDIEGDLLIEVLITVKYPTKIDTAVQGLEEVVNRARV